MIMENVKLLLKIQSQSDIITNSSSEVFLCKIEEGYTLDQFKQLIEETESSVLIMIVFCLSLLFSTD